MSLKLCRIKNLLHEYTEYRNGNEIQVKIYHMFEVYAKSSDDYMYKYYRVNKRELNEAIMIMKEILSGKLANTVYKNYGSMLYITKMGGMLNSYNIEFTINGETQEILFYTCPDENGFFQVGKTVITDKGIIQIYKPKKK